MDVRNGSDKLCKDPLHLVHGKGTMFEKIIVELVA